MIPLELRQSDVSRDRLSAINHCPTGDRAEGCVTRRTADSTLAHSVGGSYKERIKKVTKSVLYELLRRRAIPKPDRALRRADHDPNAYASEAREMLSLSMPAARSVL